MPPNLQLVTASKFLASGEVSPKFERTGHEGRSSGRFGSGTHRAHSRSITVDGEKVHVCLCPFR